MSNSNGFQSSYANERPPSVTGSGIGDVDVASDPASSSFFLNDYKKHEDLRQMLDSNKDNLKLEAMKRIIGMVAKGKDASDLFPAVVKNVVSKNTEVKKLVYVYLSRYAEEQQDLALLSISTFQRALKDPNQLIRASALRVLSSIRVPMIVPIMMLAIKESVMDMSPYVRKTAAHAIPKLYSLDPEQKDILIEVIEKLLADKTTLVAGSAIQAFEEVCPERIDLIHKNYRKLCNLLVDVEEWGQVVIINMLTRYCRMQFVNPNQTDVVDEMDQKAFYESSDEDAAGGFGGRGSSKRSQAVVTKKPVVMDADHRLLLRNARPLLNSRNAAVVMAVAQLYHHCAPRSEVGTVARALIRLLRSHREVQYVVLTNIASMSVKRPAKAGDGAGFHVMFEPYLKSFYIRSNDPTHVKLLKLEILTNLATETNISTILREFQTYVASSDKEFAAATIQAIGRCASAISEVTDTCLNGLVNLLSNRNETVVGESVVVIKKLLQMQPTAHKEIISHMAKLADSITVPMARASILWLIGEYSDRVPKIAPDVLRKMAKNFVNEEDIVKLQILNLATKLSITNPKQTRLLCQYVFNLAKYDLNYDIRDRVRFLRQLIMPGSSAGGGATPDKAAIGPLAKHARKIFLATKPAPVLESKFKDLDHFQLGTLSHMINAKANGYQELPDWPEVAPDPGVRNVDVPVPWTSTTTSKAKPGKKKAEKTKSFYSEDESSSVEGESSSESSSSSEEATESGGEEEEDADSDEEEASESESEDGTVESDSDGEEPVKMPKIATKAKVKPTAEKASDHEKNAEEEDEDEDEEESSSEEESSEDESSESSDDDEVEDTKAKSSRVANAKGDQKARSSSKAAVAVVAPKASNVKEKKPSEMLLDLNDEFGLPSSTVSILNPVNILTPMLPQSSASTAATTAAAPKPQPNYSGLLGTRHSPQMKTELLNRITGAGLAVSYVFTRTISIFSPRLISIELTFTNCGEKPIENIHVANKKLGSGMTMQEFSEIATLAINSSVSAVLAIDFNDTTQSAQFDICTSTRKFPVGIAAPVGELLRPHTLNEKDFFALQGKLSGMNENVGTVAVPASNSSPQVLCARVYEVANVLLVPSSEPDRLHLFAARSVASESEVLVEVRIQDGAQATVKVNCDKIVIGQMLLKDIKAVLMKPS